MGVSFQKRNVTRSDVKEPAKLVRRWRACPPLAGKAADADRENEHRHSARRIPRWPFGRPPEAGKPRSPKAPPEAGKPRVTLRNRLRRESALWRGSVLNSAFLKMDSIAGRMTVRWISNS